MPYESFLISDLKTGVDLNREPWISPPDAWRTMENAFIFRGRIWKRQGFGWFGELGETPATQPEHFSGPAGLKSFTIVLSEKPVARSPNVNVLSGGYAVYLSDGSTYTAGNRIHDRGDGYMWLGVAGAGIVVGAINYQTGTITIGVNAGVAELSIAIAGGGLDVNYEFISTDASVMGIESYFPRTGDETLFAFGLKRIWKYNAADERFEEFQPGNLATGTKDIWTGDLENFFWVENYFDVNGSGDDVLLIANGVDPLVYTDGLYIKELHTDWDSNDTPPWSGSGETNFWDTVGASAYARKVQTALMCFRYKNRIVLLFTKEDEVWCAQRARWSEVEPNFDPEGVGASSFYVNDYADAPTADWIVSASFLGDDLVVFFERSIWKLRWRDDFRQPFEWERLFETDGSFATMSTVDFSDEVVTLGSTGLIATDGVDITSAAEQAPDVSLDWNPQAFQYSFGIVIEEARQTLFSFTPSEEQYPTKCMVLQYEDNALSFYDFYFHTYGYYTFAASPVWEDYDANWNSYYFAWDDRTQQAGFPGVLAGTRDGRIMILWKQLSDWHPDRARGYSTPIRMELLTNRLNPYLQQGRRCRLGFLNIWASTNATVELDISIYGDFTGVAYKTKTITLDGPGEKIRRRIPVFVERAFHQIGIRETGSQLVRIDAIEMETAPAGPLRTL